MGKHRREDHDEEPESLFASTAAFCESAVTLARADGVSLALLSESPNSRYLVYATDAFAQRIDELQFALGEGPCLTAFATDRPQHIPDVARETHWTAFAREVGELGVGAVFSFPVRVGARPVAVLELSRRRAGALTNDEYDAALGCAAAIGAIIAAVYARWSHRVGDDEVLDGAALAALTETDPFAQSQVRVAAGMLAQHLGVSTGEALLRMRARAFARDMRVGEVADDVVDGRTPLCEWDERPGAS